MTTQNYLSNVKITKDRQYNRSYSSPITDTHTYDYAIVKGDWIITFNEVGNQIDKHKLSAKHFVKYAEECEITERTFKMRTKKARKIKEQKEILKKEEARAILEKENKITLYYKKTLSEKIILNIEKIKLFLTKEQIELRIAGDKSKNEICNKAVGIIGYSYAKYLGWINVISEIKSAM